MEYGFFLDMVKTVGFPAVIFVVWFVSEKHHQKNRENDSKNTAQLVDELKKNNIYTIKEMSRSNDNFVAQMKEINGAQAETFSRLGAIEVKIDNNQFCPNMRIINKHKLENGEKL